MTSVAIRWSGSSTTTRWNGFLHRQTLDPVGFEIVEAEDGITALGAFAITMPDDISARCADGRDGWLYRL
jgi:hypothetical protein